MRSLIFCVFFGLAAACAPRAALVPVPPGKTPGRVHEVFLATTRNITPEGAISNRRGGGLSFQEIDVSVPSDRELGEVRTPSGDPDPATDYLITDRVPITSEAEFEARLRAELSRLRPDDREVLIFVHGFNNVVADGVLRMAQISEDYRLPGIELHFAWPSLGSPFGYLYDRESVLYSRDGFEQTIRIAKQAGARRIVIMAHSMGGLLVMETLRQMAIARPGSIDDIVDGLILISPDLDVNLFRRQVARIGDLPPQFLIFTSDRDRALRLASRLSGQPRRLGNLSGPDPVADLDLTLVDVSAFGSGLGHFTAAESPTLVALLVNARDVAAALGENDAGRAGLLPGVAITVQNATQVILTPDGSQEP